MSKIIVSPQSRRGRRERIFCLSGDANKQKSFCSIIRRLTISAIAIEGFDLIPEETEFLLQSPSPDWSRRNFPQRSPRLCGKPGFKRSEYQPKSSIKSAAVIQLQAFLEGSNSLSPVFNRRNVETKSTYKPILPISHALP